MPRYLFHMCEQEALVSSVTGQHRLQLGSYDPQSHRKSIHMWGSFCFCLDGTDVTIAYISNSKDSNPGRGCWPFTLLLTESTSIMTFRLPLASKRWTLFYHFELSYYPKSESRVSKNATALSWYEMKHLQVFSVAQLVSWKCQVLPQLPNRANLQNAEDWERKYEINYDQNKTQKTGRLLSLPLLAVLDLWHCITSLQIFHKTKQLTISCKAREVQQQSTLNLLALLYCLTFLLSLPMQRLHMFYTSGNVCWGT